MAAVLVDRPRAVPNLRLVDSRHPVGQRPVGRATVRCAPARRRARADIIRRRRLGAATLLLGLVLLAFVGNLALQAVLGRTGSGPLAAAGAQPALRTAAQQVWVVRPGDTVWAIAETVEPGADVRPLVDRINAELHGSQLFVGERIRIPGSGG